MTRYEQILEECIEAVRTGRMDVDACVERYPAYADDLRPALTVAASLAGAMHAEPRPAFAREARERFLVATGERIAQAYDVEPSPSFFAAARFKVLMAAQRMRTAEPHHERHPMFSPLMKGLAATGAALVIFLGASTYTVASASDALPGEWRYGVKLQTERARLALAFSEGAERDVRLDIAAERAEEIERMAAKGKIIPPGVLDRMADQTQGLVEEAKEDKLDNGELQRLHAVTSKQQVVLREAASNVADDAGDQLAEARQVSQEGVLVSIAVIGEEPGPIRITPVIPLDETQEPQGDATPTPAPTDTPADGEPTQAPVESPTAEPTLEPTPVRSVVSVDPTPVEGPGDVEWVRLAVGRFSTLIPSQKHGWSVVGVNADAGASPAPTLVQLSNIDGTSLITVNPRNGDVYWFILANGAFDQIEMRAERDGQVYVVDPAVLERLYGTAAAIPLFVTQNIVIAPEPTPTPQPPTVTP
jgi:hypothetical protein